MKGNSRILVKLDEEETENLKKQYALSIGKIIASELTLEELNELIEKLRQYNY